MLNKTLHEASHEQYVTLPVRSDAEMHGETGMGSSAPPQDVAATCPVYRRIAGYPDYGDDVPAASAFMPPIRLRLRASRVRVHGE